MSERSDLAAATNVLLETSALGEVGGRETCTRLLTEDADAVVLVSYTRAASDCVEQVANADLDRVGVVTVGDAVADVERADVRTEHVGAASDLTGLGITLGELLAEWDRVAVCVDSVTAMLQYADFETAYEFLHAVTGQVYAAGARSHFHVDPEAHDDQQVAGVAALFDAAVAPDGSVRSRELIS